MELENKLYTTKEAAEILHLHVVTLRKKTREGKIQASKIGKAYLFTAQALTDFFEKNALVHG